MAEIVPAFPLHHGTLAGCGQIAGREELVLQGFGSGLNLQYPITLAEAAADGSGTAVNLERQLARHKPHTSSTEVRLEMFPQVAGQDVPLNEGIPQESNSDGTAGIRIPECHRH